MIVERHRGSATDLHGLVMPDDGKRRIWVLDVTGPTVVLGSTQAVDVVDRSAADRHGVEIARRRSGGGAVWVSPDEPVWIDVLLPRTDPLWTDDVGAAFLPVGRAWAAALAAVGVAGATVHEGPMRRTDWSDLVCFSGTGPGEVLLDDSKVVGISQRRTRAGARFQCAIPRRWDPAPLRSVLVDPPPASELATAGVGIGDVPGDALVEAFAAALER